MHDFRHTCATLLQMSHPAGAAPLRREVAGATDPFKIGLDAERAGLHTRCNESPAIMRAKLTAGKRLSDQRSCIRCIIPRPA